MTHDLYVGTDADAVLSNPMLDTIATLFQSVVRNDFPVRAAAMARKAASAGGPLLEHREDGPAEIGRYADGSVSESYRRDGKRHREDGPAVIEREADGSVSESYLRDGKRPREDGPAFIMYSADGSVMRETYSRDGKRHRENGPAEIMYRAGGSVGRVRYYHNGKLHREDGPAVIERRADGTVVESYWRDGVVLRNTYRPVEEKIDDQQ
jgi:hypothetical protein